jgi:hypothetical protein
VSRQFISTDNDEKLWLSESCNQTRVDSNLTARFDELDSDGDNVVWTHSGAVRRESIGTSEVGEFCEDVYPCAVEKKSIGFVYSGDYKPEYDWKLLVEPFVYIDILDNADVVESQRCQKAKSSVL